MKSPLLPAAALAALLLPAPASAKDDFQQWLTASVTAKVTDEVKFSNEFIARFGDAANGLYEIENVTMVGYQLNKKVTAWAGYVHNPTYKDGDFSILERRAREQVTFDNIASVGKAQISARLRMEQRWRHGIDGTGWRMRPYAKVALPLGGKTAPTLNFTTEPFFNLNNTSFQTKDGLDRVRNAVSLSMPLNKVLKAEAGYLNQHRFVANAPDTSEHALTASISASF